MSGHVDELNIADDYSSSRKHTDEEIQERIEEYADERDDLIGDIARRYLARQEDSS